MDAADVEAAAELLGELVDAVEAGELEASGAVLAGLVGARIAVEALRNTTV